MDAISSLNNIPFSKLIGGPLTATVQAQTQAAMTCIEFIEKVGLSTPDPSKPNEKVVNEVTFKYSKLDSNGQPKAFNLTVPVLAVLPLPYLRVDEVLIDFSAKLNDMVTSDETSMFTASAELNASAGWGWGRASIRAGVAYKNEKSTKSSSTQDYSMTVKVRAVQAEVPGGMQKILDMLEAAIRES